MSAKSTRNGAALSAKLLLSLLGAFLLSGCATQLALPPPPEELADYTAEPYKIGVGDQLRVAVWRNAELSLTVPVRPDGKISMPLIGDLLAADKTSIELADLVAKKLETFVRNPQVTVIVANPTSANFQSRVRITGAVRSPQSLEYRKGMTVLDLVLLAGGLNDFAAGNEARLYRKVDGEVRVYPIYVDNILNKGRLGTNFTLFPSDILTVPERAF